MDRPSSPPQTAVTTAFTIFCLVGVYFTSAFTLNRPESKVWNQRRPTSLGAVQTKQRPATSFDRDLVESLDLVPLVEEVSRHAATKRARQAILDLVVVTESLRKELQGSNGPSRRQSGLASVTSYSVRGQAKLEGLPEPTSIIRIAESDREANTEYQLIREATTVLREDYKSSLPPIYGGTSPWDTGIVETDDDEWLSLALSGYASKIDLQSVLQADKVVGRLVEMSEWAALNTTTALAPGISELGSRICLEQLQTVIREIGGTVGITRRRTVSDPSGTKSFSFQLNGDKFPALRLLRVKEQALMTEIDNTMQKLLKNKKFASKVLDRGSKKNKGSEAFDLDGRLVVSATRSTASDMGVIRGNSKSGGTCYVEPNANIKKGNELAIIREEIGRIEDQILRHQVSVIAQNAPYIDSGMDVMARIDGIFARAAFGCTLNGVIPIVQNEGAIDVKSFVHPVLAIQKLESTMNAVTPIDLRLAGNQGKRSLIISGPNGGGKTLALKSFGVVSILSKIGVPITVNVPMTENAMAPRVDFFREILVEVGDQQNVDGGESTLMARLNACAQIIQKLSETEGVASDTRYTPLVLLDELGGGTDPDAGAALARAILEEILKSSIARIVATTHSPQLKALSIEDEEFSCASVLLERKPKEDSGFKRPSFKLQYDTIGDSYALGAASRCIPSLPHGVLDRASELMVGGEERGDVFRAMVSSLEREKDAAEATTRKAEVLAKDIMRCRGAIVSLAQAHEDHLARLESRLNNIFVDLKKDPSRSAYDLVGDTLSELRHVKKKVITEKEKLAKRGLKMIPFDYQFQEGESVVIIAEGEMDGQTGTVTMQSSVNIAGENKEVAIILSQGWELRPEANKVPSPIAMKRSNLAIWDYPSDLDWGPEGGLLRKKTRSIAEAQQSLFDTLTNLPPSASLSETPRKDATSGSKSASRFTSSRERKAVNAKAKLEKRKSKKRSQKRKK